MLDDQSSEEMSSMSPSDLLGNMNKNIDIEIPAEQFIIAHKKKRGKNEAAAEEHRQAVADARAARREAAAKQKNDLRKGVSAIMNRHRAPQNPAAEPAVQAAVSETEELINETQMRMERRAARRDAVQRQAEEEFAAETQAAQRPVKRLRRHADRAWKKEASAYLAKASLPRAQKATGIANIAICLSVMTAIAVGMIVLERPTVSAIENRNLATMPSFSMDSYLNGEYTAGVANYYNDTIPFRETFKNLTASFRQHFGIQNENKGVLHGSPLQQKEEETPLVTTTTVTRPEDAIDITTTEKTDDITTQTTTVPQEEPEEEGGELSNNILIVNKRAIPLFGAGFGMAERYAQYLNSYKADLGENVNVYSLVAPTPCSYYTPDEFQYLISSEADCIQHIAECLDGVIPVDTYNALLKHKDEPIFMRTDHHWSALGAFYAAEEFTATARVPFAKITEYDKVVRSGYVGTMYGFSGDITIKNNPEDFFFYQPHANYTTKYYDRDLNGGYEGRLILDIDTITNPVSWYLVYIGTDDRVTHVHTEVGKIGRAHV